jgi:hypothetical protein
MVNIIKCIINESNDVIIIDMHILSPNQIKQNSSRFNQDAPNCLQGIFADDVIFHNWKKGSDGHSVIKLSFLKKRKE